MGQISPALPLSWLHAASSAFSHPPLPLQSPNNPPFCLSSLFRVAFLPYSPFIRERVRATAFHRFLSSMPPLLRLSQTYSLAFLPVSSPYSHHINESCVSRSFITQGRSASPHTGSTPIAAQVEQTLVPLVYVSEYVPMLLYNKLDHYIWISWPYAEMNMSRH